MQPNDMWDLVFSDEFEVDGRSFYPGDDPYWEAPSLHYWGTVSRGHTHEDCTGLKQRTERFGMVRPRPSNDEGRRIANYTVKSRSSFEP